MRSGFAMQDFWKTNAATAVIDGKCTNYFFIDFCYLPAF
jgi:hypothetical protein